MKLLKVLITIVFGIATLGTQAHASPLPQTPQALNLLETRAATNLIQQAPANSWTILVYLHGDSNLEGSTVADLHEMQAIGSSANFRLVIQWDRASVSGGVRALVTKGGLEVCQTLPEQNSDDPNVLSSFLDWGLKTFPAARTGLILWDHGGQWDGGFGGDETNKGSGMNVFDIRAAIQAAMVKNNLKVWFGEVQDNTAAPSLEITDVKNAKNASEKPPAIITFKVADKDLDAVYASVGEATGDHVFNLYSDLFYSTAEPGSYNAQWDGRLVVVSDGSNTSLFPGFFQDADDNVFSASALYTPPGETEPQAVEIQLNADSLEFISVLDDSGSSPRETELLAGGKLEFEYLQIDDTKDDYSYAPTGVKINLGKDGLGSLQAGLIRIPAGSYSLLLGATDWAGNESIEDVTINLE